MSDGNDQNIAVFVDDPENAPLLQHIVEALGSPYPVVVTPALRTVGNLVTGCDRYTDVVLAAGPLRYFSQLLIHKKRGIVKETCWALSNITAGTAAQVEKVFDPQYHLIVPILRCARQAAHADVQTEAMWVISNAASQGPRHIRDVLMSVDVLGCALQALKSRAEHNKLANVTLELLELLFENDAEQTNRCINRVWALKLYPELLPILNELSTRFAKANDILQLFDNDKCQLAELGGDEEGDNDEEVDE